MKANCSMTEIQLKTGKAVTIASLIEWVEFGCEVGLAERHLIQNMVVLIIDASAADAFIRAYVEEHVFDHTPGILPVIGPDGLHRVDAAGEKLYVKVGAGH